MNATQSKTKQRKNYRSPLSFLRRMMSKSSKASESSPDPSSSDQRCCVSFATVETPSGFPMPALPKNSERKYWPPNFQETDVDKYVQKIIQGVVEGNERFDWTTAVYDEARVKKWMDEEEKRAKTYPTREQAYFRPDGKGMVRYAVEECRWRHEHQCNTSSGTIRALHKNGFVLVKDYAIPTTFRESFMDDVQRLANDELAQKSTIAPHPRYSKIITHLVHPSMYAYEKGVTHVLSNVGAEATSMPDFASFLGVQGVPNTDRPQYSQDNRMERNRWGHLLYRTDNNAPNAAQCSNFQWLPSEFFVSTTPTGAQRHGQPPSSSKYKCHIKSYINNLHPIQHKGLYDKIGELFVEALPMLEEILTQTNDNGVVRKQLPRFKTPSGHSRNYHPSVVPWYSREEREEFEKRIEIEYKNKTVVPDPAIPPFVPPKYSVQKPTKVTLTDRPLQVIVKILQWNLTPRKKEWNEMSDEEKSDYFENPCDRFSSGHWHVEGTHDERIVASACCYLDSNNTGETALRFRDGSVGSLGCELGNIWTNAGHIVAWPNYLHHKTGSVRLEDDKKPGSRTLCCFHLVDPTVRIRSTATVPPQQTSWITESVVDPALSSYFKKRKSEDAPLARLTVKTYMTDLHVKSNSAITHEGAIERRKRLSEERSRDSDVISETFWIGVD